MFIRVYKSLLFLSLISMPCLWGTNGAGYGGRLVQGKVDVVDSVSTVLYNTVEVIDREEGNLFRATRQVSCSGK